MATDPFATTNTTTEKKENLVQNESKIVVTLKGGAGYDAPWIVIHSDTEAEANARLNGEEMKALIESTKKVAAEFAGPKAQSGGSHTGRGLKPGQPAASAQAPAGVTPPAGYIYKTGTSQYGPWQAFFPADRDSDLPKIFLNQDGSPKGEKNRALLAQVQG